MMKRIIMIFIIGTQVLNNLIVFSQSRWVKSYFGNSDTPVHFILDAYDNGYLMVGKIGSNYSIYDWLLKTDINGEVLWEKTIGDGENGIVILDMAEDKSGNIYLAGITSTYDTQGDPLVIKINPCGEKEWCRVFFTESNQDFASNLTLAQNGEPVVILNLSNPNPDIERTCLAKLSREGELIWKQCYTSTDTSQRDEYTYEVVLAPDNGFLVSGLCYYEDPEVANLWRIHPYILKTDSSGNLEWETVIYKETNLDGGKANSSIFSPNGQYYYSSISHYNNSNNFASPALAKLDMQGNVIGVYDVVTGYYEGKLSYAQFINDSTLAASAGWGNSDDDLWSRAVIIDTLGTLLNSRVLVQDLYTSILQITYDGKLVYASNTYQNNQFDCFLTKLNQNLEDDSLYTRFFTYDSLCPYQIVSDTIVQDDCGLIVGIEEDNRTVGRYEGKKGELVIWPNPATDIVNCKLSIVNGKNDISLVVYDIFGRSALTPITSPSPLVSKSPGQQELSWELDVSTLPPGIYFIVIRDEQNVIGTGKFVISH
jgi:hypothetical protein